MSDEPSEAQKLILEALSDAIAKSFVGAGEFVIDRQRVARIDGRVDLRDVAAEVDKALGGLTPEWGVAYDGGYSVEETYETEQEAHAEANSRCLSCDTCRNAFPKHVEARFVSGWTVTE